MCQQHLGLNDGGAFCTGGMGLYALRNVRLALNCLSGEGLEFQTEFFMREELQDW